MDILFSIFSIGLTTLVIILICKTTITSYKNKDWFNLAFHLLIGVFITGTTVLQNLKMYGVNVLWVFVGLIFLICGCFIIAKLLKNRKANKYQSDVERLKEKISKNEKELRKTKSKMRALKEDDQ